MNLFKIKSFLFDLKEILEDRDKEDLKQAIEYNLKMKKSAFILMIIGFVFSCYIIGIPIFIYGIYLWIKTRTSIHVNYDISQKMIQKSNKIIENINQINNCSKRWQIINSNNIHDSKRNAGADNLVIRKKLRPICKLDYFITTNIQYCMINVLKGKIIFLPNIIIYIKKNKVNLFQYNEFYIDCTISNFRETEKIPKDAKIIEYTWQYVNTNGTPDKRFKNNEKIPVCRYYNIKLQLDSFTENLMVSHVSDQESLTI